MTALLWLPDAIRDSHPRPFPWNETTDPKGCLHTTEGSGWPGYDGWTIMPHATVMPTAGKGVTVRQHLPFNQASFSLRHLDSQPTNGDYVFQFELIGTSDPSARGMYFWPNADDAVLLDLWHKVIKPLDDAFVIPFRSRTFKAYPASYGTSNGVRLSDAAFDTYSGWLGHQHVPQNDHGDPGLFPWERLVALAGNPPQPKPKPKPSFPSFPLPAGWYFGPENGPKESVSGYHGHGDDLKTWQTQMKTRGWQIDADGLYGPNVMKVASQFQKEKGFTVDGLIGKQTWDAAWTVKVT